MVAAPKFQIRKAAWKGKKLRLAISGPTGAGKTWTALVIATALGKRIAVIDTEHQSAELYARHFAFDAIQLDSFHPDIFVAAIHQLEDAGYDVIIIDSLTHAWSGKDGALEQVDRIGERTGNKFAAWGEVTPMQQRLVEAIVASKANVICTLRAKMEHVQDKSDKGRTVIRKVGMAPIQRDDISYEFDIFAEMTVSHDFKISKTRFPELNNLGVKNPGREVGQKILAAITGDQAPEKAEPALDSPPRVAAPAPPPPVSIAAPKPAEPDPRAGQKALITKLATDLAQAIGPDLAATIWKAQIVPTPFEERPVILASLIEYAKLTGKEYFADVWRDRIAPVPVAERHRVVEALIERERNDDDELPWSKKRTPEMERERAAKQTGAGPEVMAGPAPEASSSPEKQKPAQPEPTRREAAPSESVRSIPESKAAPAEVAQISAKVSDLWRIADEVGLGEGEVLDAIEGAFGTREPKKLNRKELIDSVAILKKLGSHRKALGGGS